MDLITYQETVGQGLGHLEPMKSHPPHSRGASKNGPPKKKPSSDSNKQEECIGYRYADCYSSTKTTILLYQDQFINTSPGFYQCLVKTYAQNGTHPHGDKNRTQTCNYLPTSTRTA